ncbi:thiamine pyrophosphate-binding protein [Sinorhizobium medicae]
MQTFGQYIVESLKQYGVECVFGIPGVHTIELYRGAGGQRHPPHHAAA